jgi:hypothetical protein
MPPLIDQTVDSNRLRVLRLGKPVGHIRKTGEAWVIEGEPDEARRKMLEMRWTKQDAAEFLYMRDWSAYHAYYKPLTSNSKFELLVTPGVEYLWLGVIRDTSRAANAIPDQKGATAILAKHKAVQMAHFIACDEWLDIKVFPSYVWDIWLETELPANFWDQPSSVV